MTQTYGAHVSADWYDRWVRPYQLIAKYPPGLQRARQRAVEAMDLDLGDTVVDMGCGPGTNGPHLRQHVGSEGQIIGIDIATNMLKSAQTPQGGSLTPVRGDVRHPPVTAGVDAILATFVVTLFDDPDAIVRTWMELLKPGGRLALLNVAPPTGLWGTLTGPALEIGLRVSTPSAQRFDKPLRDILQQRVETAHDAMADDGEQLTFSTHLGGFLRLVAVTKPP